MFRPGVSLDAIPGLQAAASCSNGDSSSSDCSCGSLQHVGTKYTDQYYLKCEIHSYITLFVTATITISHALHIILAVGEGHKMMFNVTPLNDLNGSTHAHLT